jgi:hypothetical protein
MRAELIAKEDLINYCLEKTNDWDDDEGWKLYHYLLEQARKYKRDTSGYESCEYLDDRNRARQINMAARISVS